MFRSIVKDFLKDPTTRRQRALCQMQGPFLRKDEKILSFGSLLVYVVHKTQNEAF